MYKAIYKGCQSVCNCFVEKWQQEKVDKKYTLGVGFKPHPVKKYAHKMHKSIWITSPNVWGEHVYSKIIFEIT